MAEPSELDRILELVGAVAHDGDVQLGDLVERLGARGFGPLLILLSGIVMLPTGMIPGIPAIVGLIFVLFAGQLTFGRQIPWLPAHLRRVTLNQARIRAAVNRARTPVRWLGRITRPRVTWLASGPAASWIVAAGAFLSGTTMIFFGFFPLMPFVLSLPVLVFGIALSTRDGLAMMLGCTLYILPAWLAWVRP